jgi:hypothetical protein
MNSPEINRRRFERLQLTEAAIAVDETGYQLGRVSAASGGGMQVDAPSPEALERMKSGARLSVTVVEPSSATTNSFDIEVCYVHGNSVGMKFV